MVLENDVGRKSLEPREANKICFGEPGCQEGIFHLAIETAGPQLSASVVVPIRRGYPGDLADPNKLHVV